MKIPGYAGGNEVEVEFEITRKADGSVGVYFERIDVRKIKKYGLRMTVGGKAISKDYQLATKLAGAAHRHALASVPGATGSSWGESVNLSLFVEAEKPSAIMNGWEPAIAEHVTAMVAALTKGFAAALAEHVEETRKTQEARQATHLARWAVKVATDKAETEMDYHAKMAALRLERDRLVREKLATTDWIVEAAKASEDAANFPEHVIAAAIKHLPEFMEAAGDEHAVFLPTPGPEIKPEDM